MSGRGNERSKERKLKNRIWIKKKRGGGRGLTRKKGGLENIETERG